MSGAHRRLVGSRSSRRPCDGPALGVASPGPLHSTPRQPRRGIGRDHPGTCGRPDGARRVRGYHGMVRRCPDDRRHGAARSPLLLCGPDPLRAREYVATSRAMMLTTGTISLIQGSCWPLFGARHRCGLARLPDCVRHFDRGIRRGELYLLIAGTRPAPVERSEGQPAHAQRHCHWCAVAAEVPEPGHCAGSSFRHHGAAAWLGLRELPARQPRTLAVRVPN